MSADIPTGISAAFNPGIDVEDTTVTLTKVLYSEALITNAGFEDPVLADGEYPWVHPGWGNAGDGGISVWNPGLPGSAYPAYDGEAPEGQNIVFVNEGDSLAQVLNETLAADTTYTLNVKVGRNAYYPDATYRVELLAGGTPGDVGLITEGTVLADTDENTVALVTGEFIQATVTFDSTGVDEALLGQPLQIRLHGSGDSEELDETNFDDVTLTADPGFISTGVQTVTVSVTVGDVVNPTSDTASIEIDVYDNACHMAKVGEGKSAITDFDENCITDIKDLAEMLTKWLDDYKATEPVPK